MAPEINILRPVSSLSCSNSCSRDGAKEEHIYAKKGESAQLHFNIMRALGFQVPVPHSIEILFQTTSSVFFSGVCISLFDWHPYCPLVVTGWACPIYVSHPLPFPDLKLSLAWRPKTVIACQHQMETLYCTPMKNPDSSAVFSSRKTDRCQSMSSTTIKIVF